MGSMHLVALALAALQPQDLASLSGLTPGPLPVAVRSIRFRDPNRTFAAADDPLGEKGRPIQILLFYPASREGGRVATVLDYVLADWTGGFDKDYPETVRTAALAAARPAFEEGLETPFREEQWVRALSVRGRAFPDVAPLSGQHPLLLFETGFNGRSYVYAHLAEMLASHGYVVASLACFGRTETERLGFEVESVRTQVADMKAALSVLTERPEIDSKKIGLTAWSAGGVAQAVLSMSTPGAFRVAVSLDSGTAYAYGAELLKEAGGVDAARLRVPFLQFEVSESASPVPRDNTFFRAHTRPPAERHVLSGLKHGDLVLPYGVARAAALGSAPPDLGALGARLLAFVQKHLAGDPS